MSSATTSTTGFDVRYRTIDLVTITTLGVAFGVIFWGWGKLYEPLSGLAVFSYPPSSALLGGVWLSAGVVGGLIVRKPGAAFATEFIAATVSVFIIGGTQWGFSVFASGFWQGLGAELIFLAFFASRLSFRRWGVVVAVLAGALAGALESFYEWSAYIPDYSMGAKLAHLGFFMLSGAVIAGVGGFALVKALARAGVLDAFPVGREQTVEV
ncbi:ECF transporter S component [Aeromicrobium fastidiosum]|uniref:ABC transporter permease n=1 Tax=Aeromicrobium fastidiosum TaxID=52699 RepID=A0A641AR55_9ACTN|nr:ECF transporter S component [Aeromicrobium fastidiosum]KAA1380172.1 ABC transporter permease [Aeromicrobium fastidiosum]MBP2389711.1 energy-coupling factor transport system substrate-specific component [Aeromicrobium fastidiosum]